jgi:hypothetical protein
VKALNCNHFFFHAFQTIKRDKNILIQKTNKVKHYNCSNTLEKKLLLWSGLIDFSFFFLLLLAKEQRKNQWQKKNVKK